MDGHFVPNISFGSPVIKSLRKHSSLVFDTHLMISEPLKYIEDFAKAGSDHITFHIECSNNTQQVIDEIRKYDLTVGISLKPNTSIDLIIPFLNQIDLILIMTVEPGFGGQKFMTNMMPKVKFLREIINSKDKNIHIQVDGGIDSETITSAFQNGANNFVAGTSVFRHPDGIKNAISILKNKCF